MISKLSVVHGNCLRILHENLSLYILYNNRFLPNRTNASDTYVLNTSEEFYQGHPYPKDFSLDIEERSLVFLGPLDHLQESILGILFQVFILSRHHSIYWG